MHKPRTSLTALLILITTALACNLPTTPTLPPTTAPPTPTVPPPTETLTVQPTAVPTETPTEIPTATATSPPAPTPTTPPAALELTIQTFIVDVEDITTGKRLTFNWQTTGATRAMIVSGASQRFPQWWEIAPNGTLTAELPSTCYRNPTMTLTAYDERDNDVSQSVTVEWPCEYDYFFTPGFDACPVYEASFTWAAEQPFENGRMIWLEEIRGEEFVAQGLILVFHDDGKYQQFEDTWTSAEPESDPTLVPPDGLYQPKRGFGKLWRENFTLRDRLGWAVAPEQGFDTAWQQQIRESIPSVAFMRTLDGQIIEIWGWGWESGGDWQFMTP